MGNASPPFIHGIVGILGHHASVRASSVTSSTVPNIGLDVHAVKVRSKLRGYIR